MDIGYPAHRDRHFPCLLITDALSRFIHGRFMPGVDHESIIISALLTGCPQWLGVPKKIIADAGTFSDGKIWNALSSIYGVTALTGRTKFVDDMQWSPIIKFEVDSLSWRTRLVTVKVAQGEIMLYGARRSLKLCIGRHRCSGSLHLYNEGDIVDVYTPKMEKWSGPYRILHDTGRNVIGGSNQRLFRHTKAWARLCGQ